MNVLGAQAIFIAVFNKALTGIDHKDALLTLAISVERSELGIFFIDDNNACRDTRAVEQVSGQANDAFDITLFEQIFTNTRFGIATEQNAVR